ncbi:MAG: hypothetical protein ACYCZN_01360 [Candidatus Dormibacteria bacterium]
MAKIDANWERAVRLVPRLAELEREILALPDPLPGDLDQAAVWSGREDRVGIKPRLVALVGWERGEMPWPAIRSAIKLCRTPEGRQALVQSGQNQPALSADEEWLQSSEAYVAATIHLSDLIPLHWEAMAS